MRAVNLIPDELRPGGGGGAGRTGGAVYIILGGLAVLVALAGAYAIYSHRIDDRSKQIAEVQREATVAQARAAALQPYVAVQQVRQQRVNLVAALAGSRFDWGLAVTQLAEALPANANVCNVQASLSSGSSPASIGCGVTTGTLRGQVGSAPAFEIGGCAASQVGVANVIAALRRIPGTTVVGFGRADNAQGSSPGSSSGPACGGSQYEVVVSFTTTPTPGTATPTVATIPAAGATGPAGAGSAATAPVGAATRVTSGAAR